MFRRLTAYRSKLPISTRRRLLLLALIIAAVGCVLLMLSWNEVFYQPKRLPQGMTRTQMERQFLTARDAMSKGGMDIVERGIMLLYDVSYRHYTSGFDYDYTAHEMSQMQGMIDTVLFSNAQDAIRKVAEMDAVDADIYKDQLKKNCPLVDSAQSATLILMKNPIAVDSLERINRTRDPHDFFRRLRANYFHDRWRGTVRRQERRISRGQKDLASTRQWFAAGFPDSEQYYANHTVAKRQTAPSFLFPLAKYQIPTNIFARQWFLLSLSDERSAFSGTPLDTRQDDYAILDIPQSTERANVVKRQLDDCVGQNRLQNDQMLYAKQERRGKRGTYNEILRILSFTIKDVTDQKVNERFLGQPQVEDGKTIVLRGFGTPNEALLAAAHVRLQDTPLLQCYLKTYDRALADTVYILQNVQIREDKVEINRGALYEPEYGGEIYLCAAAPAVWSFGEQGYDSVRVPFVLQGEWTVHVAPPSTAHWWLLFGAGWLAWFAALFCLMLGWRIRQYAVLKPDYPRPERLGWNK